jgi:type II secretory pathway component PulF
MATSAALRNYWWAFTTAILGAAAGGWAWLRSAPGKRTTDTLVLVVPQLGTIVKSFATSRISRLLGILLQGRVPMLEALELTRGACTNWHYAALIKDAVESVTRGESLALALSDPQLIPPSVREAISSGERSGQLAPLLTTLADFMDESNDVTVRSLASIMEPMILVVLGLLVGFVAISLFTPLFDLTAATGGGQ